VLYIVRVFNAPREWCHVTVIISQPASIIARIHSNPSADTTGVWASHAMWDEDGDGDPGLRRIVGRYGCYTLTIVWKLHSLPSTSILVIDMHP